MSHLSKLIERATDTTLNLENNTIGKYRITPQHGSNCYVYHIYKNPKYREQHLCSFTIVPYSNVHIEDNQCTPRELLEIYNTLKFHYKDFKFKIDTKLQLFEKMKLPF